MSGNSRNFYEELFSPDTTDNSSEDSHDLSDSISNMDQEYIFSGISMINNGKNNNPSNTSSASSFNLLRSNIDKAVSHSSGSDMDISSEGSISNSSSISKFSDDDSQETSIRSHGSCFTNDSTANDSSESTSNFPAQPSPLPVISYLDEEEISDLLGENIKLPDPEPRETLEKQNVDIIGSFNVRNRYDHVTAGELLIKEKLTFLSIQEPYASSHKVTESWKAFQKLELESARIACYETPYQIILFDSWKWGGKVFIPFQSIQYGRIASIGFDLGNNLKVGIISVYAPAKDFKTSHFSEDETHPTMKVTNNLIQKLLSKWKVDHPNMVTIILGDFQETISDLDRDNLGSYRRQPSTDGALMGMRNSHVSMVRKLNPSAPYVTRFGNEGARGIDHIFFPSDEKFEGICCDAKIQRDTGANYFPSDHSLITCSISRNEQNNNCDGINKEKYD